MRKIFIAIVVAAIAISCNKTTLEQKKTELDKLKKELNSTKDKIAKVEDEIAKLDTLSKEEKSKMVGITDVAQTAFNHYIEVQAKVQGDEDVTLSAEVPGTVTAVMVNAGDKVSKGQILATLDDRALRESLNAMKVQKDMAETMYNKQKNLWDQKIGSEVQFIQAKSQKEAATNQYESMRQQWDMTRIKSPINGTVDEVNIKVGSAVMPGVPTIRVVNLSELKVKGEVAESYISKVKAGSDVVLYFPDEKKEVRTSLTYSGQAINSLNRTFNVEVKLDPEDGNFHPNQVVILKIIDYTVPAALVVPVGAIQKSSDGEYVFVAASENGKTIARRKTVVSGMVYNGTAEIKDGLANGDKVITTGYQNVIEGDVIKL